MTDKLGPLIVGFDFHPSGKHALQHAITLAAKLDEVDVHVVGVLASLEADMGGEEARDTDRSRVEDALERLDHAVSEAATIRKAKGEPVPRFQTIAVLGDPAEQLMAQAASAGAMAIVVGRNNRGAVMRLIMGSVAERLIAAAPVPVYLTPAIPAE